MPQAAAEHARRVVPLEEVHAEIEREVAARAVAPAPAALPAPLPPPAALAAEGQG
jgi:hypothetical protein